MLSSDVFQQANSLLLWDIIRARKSSSEEKIKKFE